MASDDTTPTLAHASEEERIATAIHEAGHVVVMLLLGYTFTSVTIQPTDRTSGLVCRDETEPLPPGRTTTEMNCESAIIDAAGELAERHARGDDEFALTISPNPASDCAKFLAAFARFPPSVKEDVQALAMATPWAFFRVPEIWHAVEVVRDALLARTTLTYAEVAALVDGLLTDAIREGTEGGRAFISAEVTAAWGRVTIREMRAFFRQRK